VDQEGGKWAVEEIRVEGNSIGRLLAATMNVEKKKGDTQSIQKGAEDEKQKQGKVHPEL